MGRSQARFAYSPASSGFILTFFSDSFETCASTHIFWPPPRELSPYEVCCGREEETMSAAMHPEAKPAPAAIEASAPASETASFGTAFLGFMLTTTLTTSIMVLLSQG
jgi:hypothetical protein